LGREVFWDPPDGIWLGSETTVTHGKTKPLQSTETSPPGKVEQTPFEKNERKAIKLPNGQTRERTGKEKGKTNTNSKTFGRWELKNSSLP